MVKPNKTKSDKLASLRDLVIGVMEGMGSWKGHPLESLYSINLGVLRSSATQRHGVTKWEKGIKFEDLKTESVAVIELHPELLSADKWSAYAALVLYHEFIHALGFVNHDSSFRVLERSWPGYIAHKHGSEFTEYLRMKNAKWLWKCNNCLKVYPRKKASNGRYKCRHCSTILVDRIK